MKKVILLACIAFCCSGTAFSQVASSRFITSDIDHFWAAYDRIVATRDSAQQYVWLHQLFLDKATPGLKAFMQVRNYTDKSYIDAINNYPAFWSSIRANTLRAKDFAAAIDSNVSRLKKLYPGLRPAPIYFTIGALRSGGTTLDGMVLIGSEISLADEHTVTVDFSPQMGHLPRFFKSNPIRSVVFTNVHEYVHTQQKTTIGDNLLAQCVLEGVAEFLAVKATGQPSTTPSVQYGKEHAESVRDVFAMQLFNRGNGFWLYSNAENAFGMRDLGYYVGYAICEKYYAAAKDKAKAVREMIELDYNDATALADFVDRSGYFAQPVSVLGDAYEAARPVVTGVAPVSNHSTTVDASVARLTITFSAPMDKRYRNFDFGPLGADSLLRVKQFIGFSDDGRSATIEVELQPARRYQVMIGAGFTDLHGRSLRPYLVDFRTAGER
ncbi:MAG: Ig-like domain-containing protein [Chitinophagaceae bacterium]